MCYGNSNPQGTPGSVHNFANTNNYQGQYVGVPKTAVPAHDLMMQLDPDKFSIKNDNFNKMNYQNRNNPSVLFGGSSPTNGSAKMIK